MIRIRFSEEQPHLYPKGTVWKQIADNLEVQRSISSPIMAVESGHQLHELSEAVKQDCEARWIDLTDLEGYRIYVRTLTYLFITCAQQVLGKDKRVIMLHSLGGNLYSEVRFGEETLVISETQIHAIKEAMEHRVKKDETIYKNAHLLSDALMYFEKDKRYDKLSLLHYRTSSIVNLYELGDEKDYFSNCLLFNADRYLSLKDVLS